MKLKLKDPHFGCDFRAKKLSKVNFQEQTQNIFSGSERIEGEIRRKRKKKKKEQINQNAQNIIASVSSVNIITHIVLSMPCIVPANWYM